ncbi:hypothetical protein [Caloramator sp. mosi_1]
MKNIHNRMPVIIDKKMRNYIYMKALIKK